MRMIFVRHGDPDYEHDCLTPTGRQQAAAAAKRLNREGITTIYSSPNGRAMETAAFTAELLGLEIRRLDYMHEISWGGEGIPFKGHPWTLGDMMISQEDYDFFAGDWRRHPWFDGNTVVDTYGDQGVMEEEDFRAMYQTETGEPRPAPPQPEEPEAAPAPLPEGFTFAPEPTPPPAREIPDSMNFDFTQTGQTTNNEGVE